MVTRRDARTDANQPEILEALRKAGAWAYYIKVPFDLLVGFRGRLYLMECKVGKRKLNEKQAEVMKELMFRGVVPAIVRTPEDALRSIGAM